MKALIAQINPIVGDFVYNFEKIKEALKKADLVVFPEMVLCGYPPDDLLLYPDFIATMQETLKEILPLTKGKAAVIGCVRPNPKKGEKALFNSAAICQDGELLGFQDKRLLPEYDVFYEGRYFQPGTRSQIWSILGMRVGVTICEDIWLHARAVSHYAVDPIEEIISHKPDLIINLSSSPFYPGRQEQRIRVCKAVVESSGVPLLYCNQVGGNDSLVFDGYSLAIGPKHFQMAKGFQEDLMEVDFQKPQNQAATFDLDQELFSGLVLGVRDYFSKQGFKKAALGLSGGIDSAVVACIAMEALGPEHVLALSMPSAFSSQGSKDDAAALAENLGIEYKTVPIENLFDAFEKELSPHFKELPFDTTEENLQARIRGTLLMAFSNKFGYLILSPGNKSEMAMGYTTLYGDLCGGLGVLADVSKQDVYRLAKWINRRGEIIPNAIIEKPPSAELRPNQKDSDTLPPYDVIDTVLTEYVQEFHSPQKISQKEGIPFGTVKNLVRKIHRNEYKRRQAPPGIRVTKKAFMVGRRFPIVQHYHD